MYCIHFIKLVGINNLLYKIIPLLFQALTHVKLFGVSLSWLNSRLFVGWPVKEVFPSSQACYLVSKKNLLRAIFSFVFLQLGFSVLSLLNHQSPEPGNVKLCFKNNNSFRLAIILIYFGHAVRYSIRIFIRLFCAK